MLNKSKTIFGGFCALAAVAMLSLGAPGVLRNNVNLVWTFPTNALHHIDVFRVYSSTNLSVPVTNWPVLTNFSRGQFANLGITNGTNFLLSGFIPMDAQERYFVMTMTNFWGESFFSNVTNTPAPFRHFHSQVGLY